jgi:hypothetical protein
LVLFLQPMPSFVSRFHLHRCGGTERAAREKAAAEEKKWLCREKARKHEACQKHGVLLWVMMMAMTMRMPRTGTRT